MKLILCIYDQLTRLYGVNGTPNLSFGVTYSEYPVNGHTRNANKMYPSYYMNIVRLIVERSLFNTGLNKVFNYKKYSFDLYFAENFGISKLYLHV